jgi:hypothetical protein
LPHLDLDRTGLERRIGWFWREPGCVLENTLWAGVVDKLLAPDETFLHRKLAPGAETIGEVDWGQSLIRC